MFREGFFVAASLLLQDYIVVGKYQKKQAIKEDDCTIPPPIPPEVASEYVLEPDLKGYEDIVNYLAGQAPDETVEHAEKIKSEKVAGTRYDVWDVTTDKESWWVITSPTNLYSQKLFPSLDYTLSFHIGLMMRVSAKEENDIPRSEPFIPAWRKWVQASQTAEQADEAEDYQSVGMQCREALLTLIREASSPEMLTPKITAPKAGDFKAWTNLIMDFWLPGGNRKELRSFAKNTSEACWSLVNALTHANNATRYEAVIAVEATKNILHLFLLANALFTHGLPNRCQICGSYQLASHFEKDSFKERPYCKACGWEGELDTDSNH